MLFMLTNMLANRGARIPARYSPTGPFEAAAYAAAPQADVHHRRMFVSMFANTLASMFVIRLVLYVYMDRGFATQASAHT